MASPYVCVTCRSRLLPSVFQSRRFLSLTAAKSQQHVAGLDPDAFLGSSKTPLKNRTTQPHSGAPKSVGDDSNGHGISRGRYSGKELRPDDLLGHLGLDVIRGDQLEQNIIYPTAQVTGRQSRPQTAPFEEQEDHPPREVHRPRDDVLWGLSKRFISKVRENNHKEAWQTLQQLCQRYDQIQPSEAPDLLKHSGFFLLSSIRHMLTTVTRKWLENLKEMKHESDIPTPLDCFEACYRLNFTDLSIYQPSLFFVAMGLAEFRFSTPQDTEAMQLLAPAVELLARMWRLCMARQALHGGRYENSHKTSLLQDKTWSFLPLPETFAQKSEHSDREGFEKSLKMLVPSNNTIVVNARSQDYSSAALVTLDLLRETKITDVNGEPCTLAQLPEHAPFVKLLEAMLSTAEPRARIPLNLYLKMDELSKHNDKSLYQQYDAMLVRLGIRGGRARKSARFESSRPSDTTSSHGHTSHVADVNDELAQSKIVQFAEKPQTREIESFALTNVKRLGRAIEKRDMLYVDRIRHSVLQFAKSHQQNPTAVPIELYEHIMLAFLSLRNPQAAAETWTHIIRLGYKPTVRTYSVMMRGARVSRDRSGLEAFWRKMREAGVQPDLHAWSIRIYGLFGLRAERQGMQALAEMSREWLTAAIHKDSSRMTQPQKAQLMARKDLVQYLLARYPETDMNGVPRPNVAMMNSAISSLAHGKEDLIPEVLQWGRSLDIAPDLTTYNTLLNVALRRGQRIEALNILASMQKRGIQSNSVTWTVILTAQFQSGFLDGLDPSQQEQKVLELIASLESKETGLPGLDEKGYALIMDRLLKYHNNARAAEAVMKRMIKSGRPPTCHIYTMLMTSYFAQQPPDIVAVQHLWNYIKTANRGWSATIDNVFYDRMIENYATHHRLVGIQPALTFLQHARQAGQTTAWRALEYVARALAERQEWSKIRAIVEQARADYTAPNRAGTQAYGMSDFFNFILETGVYRQDGMTCVNDFVGPRQRDSPLERIGEGMEE